MKFISIPFISTSKVAEQAAKYAIGKGTPSSQRISGTIGRVFIYLFDAQEEAKKGTLNIEKLHNKQKISRSTWLISEAEVAFTGSIPGENLVDYEDAVSGQAAAMIGGNAENKAKQKAEQMGGLLEWEN